VNVVEEAANFGIQTAGEDITIDPAVNDLFEIYRRYNSEVVASLSNSDSTYALIRKHLQWKSQTLISAMT
jgi:hypothetical protein